MPRPSTDITLPSLGLPYGDKMPGGVVHIRPMLTSDEKLLAINDPGPEMRLRILDNLIGACVKLPGDLTPDDLLTTDRLFLFIQIRIASYGEQYAIEVECQNTSCRNRIPRLLNLTTDLPIKWADPDAYMSSLSMTMTNGDTVRFHHSTGRDEKRTTTEVKRIQKASPNMRGDPTRSIQLALQLDQVDTEGPNGFASDDPNKMLKSRAYLDNLLVSEAWEIRDALDDSSSGYTMILSEQTCPRCGNTAEMGFTPSGEFFRPFRKKSRNDSERTVVSGQGW